METLGFTEPSSHPTTIAARKGLFFRPRKLLNCKECESAMSPS